jgi:hypothetical protein
MNVVLPAMLVDAVQVGTAPLADGRIFEAMQNI